MYNNYGAKGFFRGLKEPLIGSIPINIITFLTVEGTRDFLRLMMPNMDHVQASFISGAFGGFTSLSVLIPIELLKARAQMGKNTDSK